jgi:hypothetical protein
MLVEMQRRAQPFTRRRTDRSSIQLSTDKKEKIRTKDAARNIHM